MPRVSHKTVHYEVCVQHLDDGNIFINKEHKLDAKQVYDRLSKAGFHVTMRKVTKTFYKTNISERILYSNW